MANELIPLFEPGADVTCQTTGAVVGKRFVDISATRDATTGLIKVAQAAASTTNKPFGVACYDAASGGRVTVKRAVGIIIPVTSGAAIAFNTDVEVAAGGKVIARTTGRAVGRTVEAVAGTDLDVFIELY